MNIFVDISTQGALESKARLTESLNELRNLFVENKNEQMQFTVKLKSFLSFLSYRESLMSAKGSESRYEFFLKKPLNQIA